MLEFLYKIFIGHSHKWELFERLIREPLPGSRGGGVVYILKCDVCGKLKQVNVL